MEKIILRLYIKGQSRRSELAIENLTGICEELPEHEISIIDILEHPQLAEDEEILVAPTLIKEAPLPVRRIVGDLSDRESVLAYLI